MNPKKILSFFLLFELLLFVAAKFCPPKCICVRNKVGCLHQELPTVPVAPIETMTLDLRFNKISKLDPGGFSHLHQLRSLLLNDNQLKELRSGAFDGLKRLKYLYLYRNRIHSIESGVFNHLIHLEQLYLHVNEVHVIIPGIFSNLPRLERLYLHNNKIRKVPPGSFSGMTRLRKLRLDSNALVCDCAMLWMVRMMRVHRDMRVAATCYEPPPHTGTSLAAMKETDFNCQLPEFATEPQDVTVNFGEDATFTCVATGEPAPQIVWLRDSAQIPIDSYRYEVMPNGTLMVHDADETDVGVFECMAKNQAGEAHSKPAKMTVTNSQDIGAPLVTVLPTKHLASHRESLIRFDCNTGGNPRPHIAWFYNGERILLSERFSIYPNGSLTIENVEDSDEGNYTCQAENLYGKSAASATVIVNVPPSFEFKPKSQTVSVGDSVSFLCKAKGKPEPTITWYRNSLPLPFEDFIILSDNNHNLTIIDVSEDDGSLYQCRAENSEGFLETSARLKVEQILFIPPHIVLKPEDTDAYKETTVQLPCEVESEPPATIEWRKDGSRVAEKERFTITFVGSLVIKNVSIVDTGRYECTVFNNYGRDTATAFLTVKDYTLPGDIYVNIAITQAIHDVEQSIEMTMADLFSNKTGKVDINELYRIVRFPNAPAREVARAAEIYERALDKVKEFVQAGTKASAEPFNYHDILSTKHLDVIARLSGCVAHRKPDHCKDMCYHLKYRSIDGTCNNFDHPTWGSSLTGFRRVLFPVYENGFSQPVGWNKDIKYNGYTLPSSRLVSLEIITTNEISEDVKITHMVMQWGQWLDHDLDHALPSVSSQTWDGVDCKKTCDNAAPCFPIEVPQNDTRVKNRRCIDFIRTSAVCGSGETSVLFGTLQPREQINQLTSFIDASQVYGFEEAVATDLRDLTNENGQLRVGAVFPGRKPLLPTTGINGMDCRRNLEESTQACFVAGDIRANEQIGLAAFHTIWMREHNRIALHLKTTNPHWDGDRVYNEARKIVGAEVQLITYEHWLPTVLGPEGYRQLGKYNGYNPNINPSISNVFATAALRFGHSLINPILHRYDENFETVPQGHLLLRNAFFAPWRLVVEGGVDPLLRGMFTTPAKLKTPTQNLNSELTEKLFYSTHAVALDLAAINIQRGREHGIPPYTKFRQFCNMTEVNDFDDLAGEISEKEVRDKLKKLYGSVHNIDVWVGGILEDQVPGGKMGPLFQCLLVEQFQRLRDGDRLWFEDPSVFKPEQLRQIKQISLARVLCDNGDNIDTVGENVFILPEEQDGMVSCEDLPSIDFRYWAECESCEDSNNSGHRARRSVTTKDDKDDEHDQLIMLQKQYEELREAMIAMHQRIDYVEAHNKYMN